MSAQQYKWDHAASTRPVQVFVGVIVRDTNLFIPNQQWPVT